MSRLTGVRHPVPIAFMTLLIALAGACSRPGTTEHGRIIESYEQRLSEGDSLARLEVAEEILDGHCAMRRSVPALIKVALVEHDEKTREAALNAALSLGLDRPFDPGRVCEVIEEVLDNGSAEQKQRAFVILGSLGNEAKPAIPALVRILRRDTVFQVCAARALGQIGIRAGVSPELWRQYRAKRDNPFVRAEAGLALGLLKERKAIPELIKDLQSPQILVKHHSAKALGMFGALPDNAIEALIAAADSGVDEVAIAALESLGNTYDTSDAMGDAMLRGLRSKNRRVRLEAARALSRLSLANDRIIKELVVMSNATDYWERAQAEDSLVSAGEKALPTLRRILVSGESDDEQRQQRSAARALAGISSRGIEILTEVIRSGTPPSQLSAVLGLERAASYPQLASVAICEAVERDVWSYQALLVAKKLRLSTSKMISLAVKLLEDRTAGQIIRIEAVELLGIIGRDSEECRQALKAAARDGNKTVSEKAVNTLKEWQTEGDSPGAQGQIPK